MKFSRLPLARSLCVFLPLLFSMAAQAQTSAPGGKEIALDSRRGNCVACHAMPGLAEAEQPGNLGPPLIAMRVRFPDKQALRALIWDATASRPDSIMPPLGRHRVLSEEEVDQVVEFIHGL